MIKQESIEQIIMSSISEAIIESNMKKTRYSFSEIKELVYGVPTNSFWSILNPFTRRRDFDLLFALEDLVEGGYLRREQSILEDGTDFFYFAKGNTPYNFSTPSNLAGNRSLVFQPSS